MNYSPSPSTKVELTLSARNLKDKDLLSKSDPCCVVFQEIARHGKYPEWVEIGRTEVIMNSLNPEWGTKIYLDYYFEERQKLKFKIADVDQFKKEDVLEKSDDLGKVECELAEIVSSNNGTLALSLGKGSSQLIIHAEEVDEGQKEILKLHLVGRNLDKKDLFGKSDPFLNIYRLNKNGSQHLVYRTEVIKNTLNPEWKPFDVSVRQLCQGDKNRDFLIECFDYDKDSGLESEMLSSWREKQSARARHATSQPKTLHDLIGNCCTNVNSLATKKVESIPLWNEKKAAKKGKKYTDSGTIQILKAELIREYTFLDFINGGLQLDFTVAIDFTASNGKVNDPNSLHYINYNQPNQYEMAIIAVLDICQFYNQTKMFDAYGFGAKIPPSYEVSHLFPLNLQNMNPTVYGVEGLLEAYRNCLRTTQLYGPTNFAPTIQAAGQKAMHYGQNGDRYQVLLIITDGVITDMNKTLETIIHASILPLSIIIIGVGYDPFEKMDILDSDEQKLTYGGLNAQRDIVQFVPFRNFLTSDDGIHFDYNMVQAALAKEVLAEIPYQITSYMKSKNIVPKTPPHTMPVEQGVHPLPYNAPSVPPYPNVPVLP